MKKVLKVLGKCIKWYVIVDILAWAYVGIGEGLSYFKKHRKEDTLMDMYDVILEEATEKFKKY